jgi:hypothetical protein
MAHSFASPHSAILRTKSLYKTAAMPHFIPHITMKSEVDGQYSHMPQVKETGTRHTGTAA